MADPAAVMKGLHQVISDPNATVVRDTERTQLLALSGGGYRGLFTVRLLERIEEHYQRKIIDCFDLVAGTSVGALIAAAVAQGIPARSIREAFQEQGVQIFKRGLFTSLRRVMRAPYRPAAIIATLNTLFGEQSNLLDEPLADLELRLLITAVDAKAHRARVLGGKGLGDGLPTGISLRDAVLSSAAAPTYFPARRVGTGSVLVDGGLVANAPEWIALAYGKKHLATQLDDLYLLGIGTAAPDPACVNTGNTGKGILGWLLSKRGLVQLTLNTQEELAVRQVGMLSGDRYLRVDAKPSPEQAKYLALDRADDQASEILLSLADSAFEQFRNLKRFEAFFK